MTFDELLSPVSELLAREKRASYRALKRRFELDDEDLEGPEVELFGARRLAAAEAGRVLVLRKHADAARSAPALPAAGASVASEAERRRLTVLAGPREQRLLPLHRPARARRELRPGRRVAGSGARRVASRRASL